MEVDLTRMTKYAPTRTSHATQHNCRMSLRRKGAELVIFLPTTICAAAGIVVGEHVDLFFQQTTLVIAPATNGALRVRCQHSGDNNYPHLLVPIGADKKFNCAFSEKRGTIAVEHQITDDGLVLLLPEEIQLTDNA